MGFDYAKYKAAVTGSPLNKNGFGPKEEEKTTRTGDSGSLREVISDVRTKGADLIKKIHSGFDVPIMRNINALDNTAEAFNESKQKNTLANALRLGGALTNLNLGVLPSATGKIGGQILENIIRPGTQGGRLQEQLDVSLEDAQDKIDAEKEKKSAVPKKTDKKRGFAKKKKAGPRKKEVKKVDYYYDKDKDGNTVKRDRNTREIIKD